MPPLLRSLGGRGPALALALAGLAGAARAAHRSVPAQAQAQEAGARIAARGLDATITFGELEELLVRREARSPDGRAALRQLVEATALELLAKERKLEVSERQLEARWNEIDESTRAQGYPGGLADYLRETEVDPLVFRRYLGLSIVHETLARRDLGIPPGDPITGEQQAQWLEAILVEREYEEQAFPWSDGIVARFAGAEVTRDALARHLREQLPPAALREAGYELLLERRALARMPDLSEPALEQAVAAEVERRRARAEADAAFQGLSYEELLRAQGLTLEIVRADPAVRATALAYLWVERKYDGDALRAVYEQERELFESRHGEGVEVWILLLKAAQFRNDLNPRTFEQAELELQKLRAEIEGLEDFARLASRQSEDPVSREKDGCVGIVRRATRQFPAHLSDAVFEVLQRDPGDVSGEIVGPLRMQGGVVLMCLGERTPEPTWEQMAEHVRGELRRRFVEECLPRSELETWLDR